MPKPFNPRGYQHLITDHIINHPRCNIWAGMGCGKSAATLNALSTLSLVEDVFPALVLAPLRVAQTTWPDEVAKWKNFNHLRILPIIGDVDVRKQLINTRADIYTINYENIPWLIEYCGDNWPFKTVIADESTKLKGFRLRQGTKRARALARVAHTKVRRWINLTGTPSPNGLKDLWGQSWYIDAGHRLGRTFSAFEQRWFQKSFNGFGIDPLPFAQEQIEDKLQDVTQALNAADWFDLKLPIENPVYVDMPPKARALYGEIQKRMFAEIEGHEVEAFNAASKTMKCLAEGTEILTNRGWIAIETFKEGDLVWDGLNWVSVDRLVCNGYTTVIPCWGVLMTPDHKVLTTKGWKEAREVNSANASEGLDRTDVRLPDGYRKGGVQYPQKVSPSNVATEVCVRQGGGTHRSKLEKQAPWSEEILRLPPRRDVSGGVGNPRNDEPPRLGVLVPDEKPLYPPHQQGLAQLWRQGHHRLCFLVGLLQDLLGGHGPALGARSYLGPSQQRSWLLPRELSLGDPHRTRKQSPHQLTHCHTEGGDDSGAGGGYLRCEEGYVETKAEIQLVYSQGAHSSKVKVFDLVNAGPLHRFAVRGVNGEVFLSHNCLQLANGAAYVGEDSEKWVEVHDAKIKALEDIIEEAAGMPVLVAYHFRSDLARLQRAFPSGRVLDKQPNTIRDWNAGRIPILFAHPASAGHGLSLQDGGNIIAFFSLDWNLENHLQIIERIGPTRQMQSGYDRPVFIYYILARNTVDDLVLQRIKTKREVQDLLLEAMKGTTT